MSERIQRHACDLHYLLKATPAVRKAIIDKADSSLISCICECVKNILKGHCALQPKEKKNLAKHKRDLRQLVNKSLPIKEKRRIIQKGGFLSALLAPLASMVVPLVSKLFQ